MFNSRAAIVAYATLYLSTSSIWKHCLLKKWHSLNWMDRTSNDWRLNWMTSRTFKKHFCLIDLDYLSHRKVNELMLMMMMMNCFCRMVKQQKALSVISNRYHSRRFSLLQIFDMPWAGFEPAQNVISGFVEWSCAVVVITSPQLSLLI